MMALQTLHAATGENVDAFEEVVLSMVEEFAPSMGVYSAYCLRFVKSTKCSISSA